MPESKKDRLPEARMLYSRGLSVPEIAEQLGVSAATIYRWRQAEKEAGRSWDEVRAEERGRDPRQLIAALESRLERLAADEELTPGQWFDAVQKGIQTLTRTCDLYGDVQLRLDAIEEFVAWAIDHCDEDDAAVLRRIVPPYLEHLKREHT